MALPNKVDPFPHLRAEIDLPERKAQVADETGGGERRRRRRRG